MMRKFTQKPLQPKLPLRPLELLPASLLEYRVTWQALVKSLPDNTCLIVTTHTQGTPSPIMQRIVNTLQRQGQSVYVLAIGK